MGGGTGTGGDARGSKGKGKKRSRQAQKKAEPIILEATAEEVEIKVDTVWDHHMNVVVVRGSRYVIGPQLAEMVSAETFNLYSQARAQDVVVYRSGPTLMQQIFASGAVKMHSKSVSLIEVTAIDKFVTDRMNKRAAMREKRMRGRELVKKDKESISLPKKSKKKKKKPKKDLLPVLPFVESEEEIEAASALLHLERRENPDDVVVVVQVSESMGDPQNLS